jgi:hypothetical protein
VVVDWTARYSCRKNFAIARKIGGKLELELIFSRRLRAVGMGV